MKTSTQSPLKLFLAVAAGISLASLLIPQTSWAQSNTNVDPLQDLNQEQNRDPFSRAYEGNGASSIMDLMHRAQQGNIRSTGEFSAEQDQNLNNAATKFRQQQLQMIRDRSQGNNQVNPVKTPQVTQ